MGLSNVDNAIGCRNSRHDAPVTRVAECLRSEVQRGDTAADVQAERSISGEKSRGHYRAATGDHVIALPSLAELIPVSPCSHFGPLRITDTDQLQTFAHARESDVFRRHAQLRVAKQPLALLDRFPSFFDRSEIPSLTRATNYPQPALVPVERKSASNGKCSTTSFAPRSRWQKRQVEYMSYLRSYTLFPPMYVETTLVLRMSLAGIVMMS